MVKTSDFEFGESSIEYLGTYPYFSPSLAHANLGFPSLSSPLIAAVWLRSRKTGQELRNSIFSSAPYTLVPSTLPLPIRDPVSLYPTFEWLGKSNNLFKL